MLDPRVKGTIDPEILAELAQERLRAKIPGVCAKRLRVALNLVAQW
jgi:hypothetical protein